MENKYQKYRVVLVREEGHNHGYKHVMTCPNDVSEFLTDVVKMGEMDRECLVVIAVDCKGGLVGYNIASVGELSFTAVSPREIMKYAILSNAAGIILAHNHISGDITPSKEDIASTKRMIDVGRLMSIPLYDHIIFADGKCSSMMQSINEESK